MCVGGRGVLTAVAPAWRSEDNTEELVLSTLMRDLESDLTVVTLSASTFALPFDSSFMWVCVWE